MMIKLDTASNTFKKINTGFIVKLIRKNAVMGKRTSHPTQE